jgi:hypothetical protein
VCRWRAVPPASHSGRRCAAHRSGRPPSSVTRLTSRVGVSLTPVSTHCPVPPGVQHRTRKLAFPPAAVRQQVPAGRSVQSFRLGAPQPADLPLVGGALVNLACRFPFPSALPVDRRRCLLRFGGKLRHHSRSIMTVSRFHKKNMNEDAPMAAGLASPQPKGTDECHRPASCCGLLVRNSRR